MRVVEEGGKDWGVGRRKAWSGKCGVVRDRVGSVEEGGTEWGVWGRE